MPSSTVVITNHQRPEFLVECLDSCERAWVKRLVVTSTSTGPEVQEILRRARDRFPEIEVLEDPDDPGNNESWLRGLRAVKTEWATLLHDDDLLLPAFSMMESLNDPVDFYCWAGRFHGRNGALVAPDYTFYPKPLIEDGIHPAYALTQPLLNRTFLTLSPVAGCFKTEHLKKALEEFAAAGFGKEVEVRPTMVTGNDLLIWLRALSLNTFRYIRTPLNSYGAHPGSISYDDHIHKRGAQLAIYNIIRAYYESVYLLPPDQPGIRVPRSKHARSLAHLVGAARMGTGRAGSGRRKKARMVRSSHSKSAPIANGQ